MNQTPEQNRRTALTYVGTEEYKITGNSMATIEQSSPAFAFIMNHQVKVVLQGDGYTVSGSAYSDELFLIPANHACTLRNLSELSIDVVIIYFALEEEGAASFVKMAERAHLHTFRLPQAKGWLPDFLYDTGVDEEAVFFQLQSHLYAIVSGYVLSVNKPREASDLIEYVKHSKQFMRTQYMGTIDIEDLARSSGFSPSRFYQAFRRHTGLTPLKYITKIRLDASLRLLANASTTVVEAAHAVGYPDEYYFSRLFKKQMGMTPTEYVSCANKQIASLSPVFLGDFAVLGLAPQLSFERGWQENKEIVLRQLMAARPEMIVVGPVDSELHAALLDIAPVTMLHWKGYSWKSRLLDISALLGLTTVAERWMFNYDQKVENARTHVKSVLGSEPTLLVQYKRNRFRIYGVQMNKINDVFYKELQINPPLPVQSFAYKEATSLQEIAALGCENIILFVHASTPQSECDELEYRWRRLMQDHPVKRCMFIRHPDSLHYSGAVYESLIDEMVDQLASCEG